jgi:hypothetical protein
MNRTAQEINEANKSEYTYSEVNVSYSDIIKSFGEILVVEWESGYQGDTLVLLKDEGL